MKSVLAIVDYRVSETIKKNLAKCVNEIFLFDSGLTTYNSISGHPDIFIYHDKENLIVAPNAPTALIKTFNSKSIQYKIGLSKIGSTLQTSTYYNCISTEKYLFHKKGFTDTIVLEANEHKAFIELPQAYTRCSILNINEEKFITSDKGIEKVLNKNNFTSCFFSPEEIEIFDHKNGFLGGTTGIYDKRIFFLGNILKHSNGKKLEQFIEQYGLEIICLGNNYLYDGGGIFFV